MKVKEVIKTIEEKYPLYLKEKWDNIGLIVGDGEQEVSKILVTLDVTTKTIDEAIELGCNMIVSHHPFIFDSLKTITTKNSIGKRVMKAIKNDIAIYSMHTNLDIAQDGLNDYLAKRLELENVEQIDPDRFSEDHYIRHGDLKQEMSLKDLTGYVKEKLNLEHVIMITRDDSKAVKHIALCSGSGKSFAGDAIKIKADCYITGDYNYHGGVDILEDDFNVIDASHFGTEYIVTGLLHDYLSSKVDLEVIESKVMINPLKIY